MALNVASATLSITWAEWSTVAFTAGSLPTLSACIEEVQSKVNRGTLGASSTPTVDDVARWIARGKQELAEVKNFSFRKRYVTASTTAGTYRYALPPDYGGGDIMFRDLTNDRQIVMWPESTFDTMFPDVSEETNDEIQIGCIKNREIWFAPPPNGTYTIEAVYDRTGEDITASDMSWLPEIERFRVCDFAVAEVLASLKEYDKASFFYNRWEKGLGKAIRADGKRKWKRMRYQAISIMQDYSAWNNQP